MIYINTKTRATIDSPTQIFGGDWILKDQEKQEQEQEKQEAEVVDNIDKGTEGTEEDDATEVDKDIDGLTKADIMQELDAFGIEYDKKATKAQLYELMMSRK